jgi:uncharacterized protein YfaS (alpha-2-macroglobulin family)
MALPFRSRKNSSSQNHWKKIVCLWLLFSLACRLPGGLSQGSPNSTSTPATQPAVAQTQIQSPAQASTTNPTPAVDLPPAVVETLPLSGSQIGSREKITFSFNQAMDRDSVEKAFVFPTGVSFQITWDDDQTVSVQPSTPLSPDSRLALTIDSSARAANGKSLLKPFDATYQTGGLLKVTQVLPANASQDIYPNATVSVSFDQPVVVLGSSPDSQPAAFTLDPPAQGQGRWLNTSTYVFLPQPALTGGQAYTLTLNPELTALTGFSLDSAVSQSRWTFQTGLPKIITASPDGSEPIALDQEFMLEFNQPMDPASVEAGLKLFDPAQTPVPLSFQWNQDNTQVTYTPESPLARSTAYTLSLTADVKTSGGTGLGNGLNQSLTTLGALALKTASPSSGQSMELNSGYGSITLQFNAPLARQTFKDLVSIEPAVSDLSVYAIRDQGEMYVSGFFNPSSSYQVTISPALSDRYGGKLADPVVLSLTTAPAQPELTIPGLMSGWPSVFLLPDDAQINVSATNLYNLQVTSGHITLADFIRSTSDPASDAQPQPTEVSSWNQPLKLMPNRSESLSVPLSNYDTSLKPGLYQFKFSAAELGKSQPSPFLGMVSHTQILMKRSADEIFLWAIDLTNLQPAVNQSVTIFSSQNVVVGSGATGSDGVLRVPLPASIDPSSRIYAVIGQPGEDNFSLGADNWSNGIMGWNFNIPVNLDSKGSMAYVYTDRPIYQPGQTVYFRAILRQAENGRYTLLDQTKTTVTIRGAYSDAAGEQPVLATLDLPLTAYGTATGSFKLPDDSETGQYTLSIDQVKNAQIGFKVAAYHKPQIDLQVKVDPGEALASARFDVHIQADYYFGAPAAGQKITWNINAIPEDLPLSGGYQTGRSGTDWIEQSDLGAFGEAFVLEKTGVTGADGSYTAHISADDLADHLDLARGQRLTVEATLTQPDNTVVSSRASIRIHPAEFYIGLRGDAWESQAGSQTGFSVQTVAPDGSLSGGHSLQARFDRITWEEDLSSASPFFNGNRWKAAYTPTSSTNLVTDQEGRARIAFTPGEPGLYTLAVQGEGADTRIPVWVSGAGSAQWPTLPDQHLKLVADASEYQSGQTANIFLSNPFSTGAKALISVERGKVMRAQVIDLNTASLSYPIDLSDADAPNVYVSVTLIGQTDGHLDFRQGYLELKVKPAAEILKVEMTPQSDRSSPGAKMDFSLRVSDAAGNPVQGEFSLALVDKAVLALAAPNASPIDQGFYADQDLGVVTSLPLAIFARRTNTTTPGGRGGGSSELPTQIRSKFADTAFWNGSIETDAGGRATISVTLPDNLTTWVATVRGLDRDTRVGEASGEVVVSKDLMVQPATPRFLVVGDHVQLTTVVYNNTRQDLDTAVSLLANGAVLDGAPDPQSPVVQQIHLPAGGNQRVNWWASVQPVEKVHLVFSAQASGGSLSDAATPEEGDLPVLRYQVPITVGTAGMLSSEGSLQEVIAAPTTTATSLGDLTVELSPSLAAAILSGLNALDNFDGNDPEFLLSRFLPNLETYRVIQSMGLQEPTLKTRLDQNIKTSVARLSAAQNDDGGWSWVTGQTSDTFLSSYIFFGLSQAYNAGVIVDLKVIEKARDYLQQNLPPIETLTQGWQYDRAVYQYFVLAHSGMVRMDNPALYEQRDRLSPWAKALLAVYLQDLDPTDQRAHSLIADLGASAVRSSTGAHWENVPADFRNFDSANFNTAAVVYAIAQIDPAEPLLTDAVRYLVQSRQPRGGWASSYETAWVLLALDQALKGTADLQAGFDYSATLNGQRIAGGAAQGVGSLTPVTVTVPSADLQSPTGNLLTISRGAGNGRLSYRAFVQVYQPAEAAVPIDHGLTIQRTYTLPGQDCQKEVCTSLTTLDRTQSDTLSVRLTLTLPHDMVSLVVKDNIPAGAEIIDPTLLTTPHSEDQPVDQYDPADPFSNGWGWWLFSQPQIDTDHIQWSAADIPAGTYVLTYRLRLLQAGQFRVLPALSYERYFPDVYGTGAGEILEIKNNP